MAARRPPPHRTHVHKAHRHSIPLARWWQWNALLSCGDRIGTQRRHTRSSVPMCWHRVLIRPLLILSSILLAGGSSGTEASQCRRNSIIHLSAHSVLQLVTAGKHQCAAGMHVVFIASNGLASTVMRGRLTLSVLRQTNATHGARASLCGPPCNATHLATHLERHGEGSVCVVIKYASVQVHQFCRSRGMAVVLDSVDNYRGFDPAYLRSDHYQSTDAILVQTQQHADWLARHGLHGVVLPHPHGNLNGWSLPTTAVRTRIRGVGLLVGDMWRNLPSKDLLAQLAAACCAHNATLYVVHSPPQGAMSFRAEQCPNASMASRVFGRHYNTWATHLTRFTTAACTSGAAEGPLQPHMQATLPTQVHGRPRAHHEEPERSLYPSSGASTAAAVCDMHIRRDIESILPVIAPAYTTIDQRTQPVQLLADETGQRRYYAARRLHEIVDVALLWRDGRAHV